MRKHSRAFTACISTAALVGFGAAAMAPMASAAPVGGSFAAASIADVLVDEDAETTLTIHKYLGAPVAPASNGTEVTDIALPTLAGVQFDVYLVEGVDLTTNAGWAAATALQAYTITQADIVAGHVTVGTTEYTLTAQAPVTTNEAGEAVFTGGVGLYLVNENVAASGVITDSDGNVVPNSSVTPTAPFMVTLPMTHPTNLNAWMYDVHAYPKNASDTVVKTVQDEGTLIGSDGEDKDAYSYTIDTSVTPGLTAAETGTYVVGDQLDGRVSLTAVTLTAGETVLTEGTHYTVYVNDVAWDGTETAGAKVEVVLTEAGIESVITAGGLSTVLSVTADSMGDGVILNDAQFVPNAAWWAAQTRSDDPFDVATDDPDNPGGTGDAPVDPITSNEVRSLFGSVNITKTDAADDAVLEGVTFQLWLDANGNLACDDVDFAEPNVAMYEGVTDEDGLLTFSGLQTSNFYDDALQTELNGYCLVETEAADGYNLLADPVYFEINAVESEGAYVPSDTDVALENVRSNLDNDLPLTGGAGAAGLGLGALLLLGGAGAYAMKRRQDTNESVTVQG